MVGLKHKISVKKDSNVEKKTLNNLLLKFNCFLLNIGKYLNYYTSKNDFSTKKR